MGNTNIVFKDVRVGSISVGGDEERALRNDLKNGVKWILVPQLGNVPDSEEVFIQRWNLQQLQVPVISSEAAIDELRRELQQINEELTDKQRENFEAAAQRGLQHNAIREAITPLIVALDDFIQKSAEGDDLYKAALRKKMIKEKTDLEDKYEVYPLRG